ncbi:hypothetical protein LCGC14_1142910 [marine sediment metagenome]|uniref:Uncharacterized protein n=1 Tax=marine sediment metagenome TaxID=412755 RepID=A0A0F9PFY6_9ZZZZ|nr:hypothetical protein [Candidatus Aminicenantes bacterium]HEB35913.1 hypothetical protein [Candidatus Aminicenantes bacterium]
MNETLKTFDYIYEESKEGNTIKVFRFIIQKDEGQVFIRIEEYGSPGGKPGPFMCKGLRGLNLKPEILPDMISALRKIISRISKKESNIIEKSKRILIFDAGAYGSAAVRPFTIRFQDYPSRGPSVIIKRQQKDSNLPACQQEWHSLQSDRSTGRARIPINVLPKFIDALQQAQEILEEIEK